MELIIILSRLGHSVSYSQKEEIDTALCPQNLSSSRSAIALSVNIHPGVFATLVWDNIESMEEIISCEGTSHRVNGIAIQKNLSDPVPA